VCSAEMSHYASIARRQALPIHFIDSTRQPDAFLQYGLRAEHLERRRYHRNGQGRLTSGLDAMLEVWDELPRYRWAARALALPVLHAAASAAYDLVVAPSLAWNGRRRRKLGRTRPGTRAGA
jgi:predicted DCC family thiol-disulfide oxidoreductase YuxK